VTMTMRYLLALLSMAGAQAFVLQPQRPSLTFLRSTTEQSKSTTTTDTSSWIEERPFHTHVVIYDTTLRDGTQGESVSASADDKLKICHRLASFGVDYIEAGWPGSNPKDAEFFRRAIDELSDNEKSKLTAFGSTRRKNINVQEDPQVQALLDSQAPTICIVAKAHHWQVTEILKATPQENLDMIRDTIHFLVNHGRTVFVDLEHFFDGYQDNPNYVLQCCEAAADAGASCLVLCDTNGGTMPWTVGSICQEMSRKFEIPIGIHCHNDCGMAVANSVMAVQHGAGMVQGTMNGIGERTGNADLCSIVPSLALHMNTNVTCHNRLTELTKLSRYVDEILNRTPNQAAPFVGSSAFAHKGGLHVAAMERSPLSYQHIEPELVGNEKRILISELSGRQNIMGLMEGIHVDHKNERSMAILNRVKQLEAKGYTFEGAEASVQLMILHSTHDYCPPFSVLDYAAQVYDANMDSASRVLREESSRTSGLGPTARATVKVRTMCPVPDGLEMDPDWKPYEDRLEVSDGNGPVDALANALLRALIPSHPYLEAIELVDYKVRILDPESATGAATRVLIEFRDALKETTWTTVSVDTNVISASLNALVDGFEFALVEHAQSCMLCNDDYEY